LTDDFITDEQNFEETSENLVDLTKSEESVVELSAAQNVDEVSNLFTPTNNVSPNNAVVEMEADLHNRITQQIANEMAMSVYANDNLRNGDMYRASWNFQTNDFNAPVRYDPYAVNHSSAMLVPRIVLGLIAVSTVMSFSPFLGIMLGIFFVSHISNHAHHRRMYPDYQLLSGHNNPQLCDGNVPPFATDLNLPNNSNLLAGASYGVAGPIMTYPYYGSANVLQPNNQLDWLVKGPIATPGSTAPRHAKGSTKYDPTNDPYIVSVPNHSLNSRVISNIAEVSPVNIKPNHFFDPVTADYGKLPELVFDENNSTHVGARELLKDGLIDIDEYRDILTKVNDELVGKPKPQKNFKF